MKKNLLLLAGTLFIALLLSEITLRILNIERRTQKNNQVITEWVRLPEEIWTEYDPDLGWFHQKNRSAALRHGSLPDVQITTNNNGFRSLKDYSKEKPAGVRRILLLGDSFVFGWGVRDHETLGAQLESKSENLEAINLGVCAYGIDQMLLSFRKFGKQFHPDYVFIGVYQEDFWRATRTFTDGGYAKPYFLLSQSGHLKLQNVPAPKPFQFQLRTHQFPGVINRNPIERLLFKSALYRFLKKSVLRLGRDLNLLDPSLDEEWLLGRAILSQLIAEIRLANAEPVILIIPPEAWLKNTKPTSLEKSLSRFAEREGVDLINLTPLFVQVASKTKITDYYIKDDWHWTAQGHQFVAEILSQYLKGRI